MKDFFQTTEQLIEPLNNSWSLYAPVYENDFFDLELAYWAEAPRNTIDSLVCQVSDFHPRHVTAFSLKDIDDELTYHARVPETWVEAQILYARLDRDAARSNIIGKLLGVPITLCLVLVWAFSVPVRLLLGFKVRVFFTQKL